MTPQELRRHATTIEGKAKALHAEGTPGAVAKAAKMVRVAQAFRERAFDYELGATALSESADFYHESSHTGIRRQTA